MSDKKNEDFAVRMPESGSRSPYGGEKDPFVAPRPSRSSSSGMGVGLGSSWSKIENSPPISILAYCLASISMTVVNKFVVSGSSWNLNFFYLAVQVRLHSCSPPQCPVPYT
jgi:GDP-mannose transporter